MSNRLDEMNFVEVSNLYHKMFKNIISKSKISKISEKYKSKYEEILQYISKGFRPANTMGRGIKYTWNILWGWYFEELLREVLIQNKEIGCIKETGHDSAHNFLFHNETKKILIEGEKTTTPDFLITLKNGKQFFLELKTASAGVFTIKRGNVVELYKTMGLTGIYSMAVMIDLVNAKYGIHDISFFNNKHPFVNQRMEGQLCYELPVPSNPIKALISENFSKHIDLSAFKNPIVVQFKFFKFAEEHKKDLKINLSKLIKDKMSCDKLTFEFEHKKASYLNDLENKIRKNPNIKKYTWDDIKVMIDTFYKNQH